MNFHKKGQGLSMNVIIIALLALIVLVILTVLFTTNILKFETGTDKAANVELSLMKSVAPGYGKCKPTALGDEKSFLNEFATAGEDAVAAEAAKSRFKQRIQTCKAITDKTVCEAGGCSWG